MAMLPHLRNRALIVFLACFVFLAMLSVGVAQTPGSPGDVTADLVLGQLNFTTQDSLHASSQIYFENPQGVAIDRSTPKGRVYVVIPGEDRVLGWDDASALTNGAPAVLVIGQSNFTATGFSGSFDAAHLNEPEAVAVDSKGNLYVSDFGSSRVLEFKTPFAAGCTTASPCVGESASLVFGQGSSGTNFTQVGCNTAGTDGNPSAVSLCSQAGLALDSSDNLYVADRDNFRVLQYEQPLASAGGCTPNMDGTGCPGDVVADLEWGQGGGVGNQFTMRSSGSALDEFGSTDAVALDSNGTMYVADSANSRALGFANALTTFTATLVFGTGGSIGSTPVVPQGVAVDSKNNVYLSGSNRILEYEQPTASSGGCAGAGTSPGCPGDTVADLVFGQGASGTDFTDETCNDGSPSDPTAVTL